MAHVRRLAAGGRRAAAPVSPANGRLSFTEPTGDGFTSFISDPARPVPYMARPIDGTRWRQWMVEDQRFVHNRPDVLSWETEPLTADVTIAGDIVANLFASTTGSDADWVVKLIDVYPDSVAGGSEDGRLSADGRERHPARPLSQQLLAPGSRFPSNSVQRFSVDLHQQLYTFGKGHRIMVQVQSTWFPLYDRNPQNFVVNIFKAKPSDFSAQEHRIQHAAKTPSHMRLTCWAGQGVGVGNGAGTGQLRVTSYE